MMVQLQCCNVSKSLQKPVELSVKEAALLLASARVFRVVRQLQLLMGANKLSQKQIVMTVITAVSLRVKSKNWKRKSNPIILNKNHANLPSQLIKLDKYHKLYQIRESNPQ